MKIMIDTEDFLVLCPKLNPRLQIRLNDCVQCGYHRGVLEVWPGENNQEVERQKEAVTLEPQHGKMRVYDIKCGLPTRIRLSPFGHFAEEE